jgi:hypothetical protein
MRTAFNPREHGFTFRNDFVNHVVTIPALHIDITTLGRCGGMAATALDCWHHRLAVPDDPSVPADGSLLGDYIYGRLLTTMAENGAKFLHFMRTPDHPTWINGIGVARATREEELPRIKAVLDAGQPCLLGLSQARSIGDLGNDHQVVAYGYETDGRYTSLLVYDNNHPGTEVRLRFTADYDPGERQVEQSVGGKVWRGFFLGAYSPVTPPFLADGRLLSEASDPAIHVVRGGGRFHIPSPEEFEAAGFDWGQVAEVPDGSLRHVAAWPANRTLIRERSSDAVHVAFGGTPFPVAAPDALGLDPGSVRMIPDGSLAGLPRVPRDGTLVRELNDPAVYVTLGGVLRHVPSPQEFEARGYAWDAIGVVPDGALAGLAKGDPLSITPVPAVATPQSWAERGAGEIRTGDGDRISYSIQAGVRPADEVEFILTLDTGITWRKELVLQAEDGQWTIAAQDGTRSDRNGLYRYQLPNGHLLLRKAKTFGIMSDIHGLAHLDQLPAGAQVSFTWSKD